MSRVHTGSIPNPSGETIPIPVTTTRRMPFNSDQKQLSRDGMRLSQAPMQASTIQANGTAGANPPAARQHKKSELLLLLFDKLDGVANRLNCLSSVIRNFNVEFFLKRHDKLDNIEAVCTEVIDEARFWLNFRCIYVEVLDNNFLYAFRKIRHSTLLSKNSYLYFPTDNLKMGTQPPERSYSGRNYGILQIVATPKPPI
jgi:hypothetical protein